MKNVPIITALLWLTVLLGYGFLPQLFMQDLFQFPLVVVLSILLPVSFWQMANMERKYLSLLFVGIFIINVSMLLFVLKNNYSAQQSLSRVLNRGVNPELVEYTETGANDQKRKFAARTIYQLHGISLPYKNGHDGYALYSPGEQDREKYRENLVAITDLKLKAMDVSFSFYTTFSLLVIHITLFIVLLVFLVLYEGKDSREAP